MRDRLDSFTGPPAVYPVVPPPFTLPSNHPLTAADLAHYLAAPAAPVSVSSPYLVRPSPPPWPMQTGINVVPAAMLAADVLPEYYYGLSHPGLATSAAYPPASFHMAQPPQQHPYPCPPSSVPHQQSRPAADVSSLMFFVLLVIVRFMSFIGYYVSK